MWIFLNSKNEAGKLQKFIHETTKWSLKQTKKIIPLSIPNFELTYENRSYELSKNQHKFKESESETVVKLLISKSKQKYENSDKTGNQK